MSEYSDTNVGMGHYYDSPEDKEIERLERKLEARNSELAQLRAELESARGVQQQYAAERAKALEELAYEKRRFERSREAAKDTWATHEKQFADQQEKLDAANARNAELEVELFIRTKEKVDTLAARNAELEAEVARLREARCSTCAYWQKCPTIVPGCEPEMICGYSKRGGLGLNGQDGRAIITPPDFGCLHWRAAMSAEGK